MGWSSNEEETKQGRDTSSKIILGIIVCLSLIVLLIVIMLFVQLNKYTLSIDNNENENYDINKLISKIDNLTYINIEEFAKLVGYEYHKGEFKAYTNGENKCYVQGNKETASFFLNDNKIYKLPVDQFDSEYRVVTTKNPVIQINGKLYAETETINIAFNTSVEEKEKEFIIYTLEYLVNSYDKNVKKWGYTGIKDLDFENQKALLYNRLIVKKKDGLYKIINTKNTEEIVPDRYTSIEFREANQEFNVTNSFGQIGILNIDGTTKIEPVYDNISVLDENSKLYLVETNKKFGIVKSGNTIIASPEYDKIGLDDNGYFILNTLIPVYKNNKWGAIDRTGKVVYGLEYDGFGCELTTVEIGGEKKTVNPVISIEVCNGVVVKKDEKYGLLDLDGKELVPLAVSSIYEINEEESEELKYFMIYNDKELNVIERLIKAGLIEGKKESTENDVSNIGENKYTNNIENNNINASESSNIGAENNQINIDTNIQY